jgi:hypothetical protein
MPEYDPTLILAALAVFITVVLWLIRAITGSLGDVGAQLRSLDARLVNGNPELAGRLGAMRTDLAAVSTQTERALWSLSRFDERAEAAREVLAGTRSALDKDRARLIAARGAIIRIKKSARMIMKALELRRAILG